MEAEAGNVFRTLEASAAAEDLSRALRLVCLWPGKLLAVLEARKCPRSFRMLVLDCFDADLCEQRIAQARKPLDEIYQIQSH